MKFVFLVLISSALCFTACKTTNEKKVKPVSTTKEVKAPEINIAEKKITAITATTPSTKNMILVDGGTYTMGNKEYDKQHSDEYPAHEVKVNSFYIDANEVTNAQFKEFIDATGYITTAEEKPDWNEIKKQLPPGTPKPDESLLFAASMVFTPTEAQVPLNNPMYWWQWQKGASWKHPQGPDSSIEGKDNYPVIHVSWYDATAYAKWAGKRLPTEAEWEYAAGGGKYQTYTWGEEDPMKGNAKANLWEGNFPYKNTARDGYLDLAPVKKYKPNAYGIYDMAGNVNEWCSDWYSVKYYAACSNNGVSDNPIGPDKSFDPREELVPKRVMRGGSFTDNHEHNTSYRVQGREKNSPDSGFSHTGFRCVLSTK